MIAARNLLTPDIEYAGVSVVEMAKGHYARVFLDNSKVAGTPIPEQYVTNEQFLAKIVEAAYALNSAHHRGEFTQKTVGDMGQVSAQMRYFLHNVLPKFRERLAAGTLFEGGKVRMPSGLLDEKLPETVIFRLVYDPSQKLTVREDGESTIAPRRVCRAVRR